MCCMLVLFAGNAGCAGCSFDCRLWRLLAVVCGHRSFVKLILDKGVAPFHWKHHILLHFILFIFAIFYSHHSSSSILLFYISFWFFFTLIHFFAILFFMHDLHHHMFTFTLESFRMDLIPNLAIRHIIYNPNALNHSPVFKH